MYQSNNQGNIYPVVPYIGNINTPWGPYNQSFIPPIRDPPMTPSSPPLPPMQPPPPLVVPPPSPLPGKPPNMGGPNTGGPYNFNQSSYSPVGT